ncbi:DUF3263 domain-containing protein [Streptomyces sp. KLOTTS4A1]|uniref:DUF3263 domain-containing protein n=1 Tax=Streptomyces sp. KLOTTS4A1 TaxID=3390996 RepID=UPI0039F5E6A6
MTDQAEAEPNKPDPHRPDATQPDPHRPDPHRPDATQPGPVEPALGARERAVLAIEQRNWVSPGAKERAIREELAMSPTRYHQLLNVLLDDERALAHDPVTVNRLRRIRAERRARR